MDDTNQNVVLPMQTKLKKSEVDPQYWEVYKTAYLKRIKNLPKDVQDAKIQLAFNLMAGIETSIETKNLASSLDVNFGEWDVGEPVGKEVIESDSAR